MSMLEYVRLPDAVFFFTVRFFKGPPGLCSSIFSAVQVIKAAASEGWPHVLLLLNSMTEDWNGLNSMLISHLFRVTYPTYPTYPPRNNPDGTCPICRRFTHWIPLTFQTLSGFHQNWLDFDDFASQNNGNDITSAVIPDASDAGNGKPRRDQLQHCDPVLWPSAAHCCTRSGCVYQPHFRNTHEASVCHKWHKDNINIT